MDLRTIIIIIIIITIMIIIIITTTTTTKTIINIITITKFKTIAITESNQSSSIEKFDSKTTTKRFFCLHFVEKYFND